MNAPQAQRPAPAPAENSVVPENGWHCGHFFYRFDRDALPDRLSDDLAQRFREAFAPAESVPQRLASYWISGHEVDFGVMVMDPDPAVVDSIHQRLQSGGLGKVIKPAWSFVSISEVSEYVPSVEQYRERLIREGTQPDAPELAAKVAAYERRLPMMNQQRLKPEIPDWPAACFYPMNKSRVPGANWFSEPFSRRNAMMAQHAQSGIAFANRVSQLISVGVGLDDWEWMVTLWARNPQFLKDIVYQMRFDEASAKYAEFGPFYVGYQADADAIMRHCRVAPTTP